MTEVLTEVNYKKIEKLIPVLEKNMEITPKSAETILEMSTSTTYRYLSMLVKMGILKKEGNTNNVIYSLTEKYRNQKR